jgi:anti-sigma regulatory factor (Ser/Thr protein kinase)
VTAARRWLADCLRRWDLHELVGTAELLVSELVANAVVHAKSRPISTAVADGVLEVGVSDRDRRRPPSAPTESGRSTTPEDLPAARFATP